MSEEFVSEPIRPLAGSADAAAMSRGEPGLPRQFLWRDESIDIATVVLAWKSSTRDRGELYLRRHWYEVTTSAGWRMKIYCERQARNRARPKARWWLYSLDRGSAPTLPEQPPGPSA